MKTAHSSVRISTLTPSRRQAFWAITMIACRSSLPALVMSVKARGFPSFSRIPSSVLPPARLGEQPLGARGVVGQGLDVRVVVLGLLRIRPRRPLALAVEDVADDLVDVDRHAEGGRTRTSWNSGRRRL